VAFWQEAASLIQETQDLLVVNDATPDKPHVQKMGLVNRHWSGEKKMAGEGINLAALLWMARVSCHVIAAIGQAGVTRTDTRLLKPPVFKRLTGVSSDTFSTMVAALTEHLPTGGRRAKYCQEDQLLMVLMYWHQYRTYVHIAHTYSLSESTVCRTVHAVENALLRYGAFTLPGRKALTKSDIRFKVIVVDATECPVERPKKALVQRQGKAAHPKSAGCRRPKNRTHPSHGVQRRQNA